MRMIKGEDSEETGLALVKHILESRFVGQEGLQLPAPFFISGSFSSFLLSFVTACFLPIVLLSPSTELGLGFPNPTLQSL